jgi:hypothetical protein
MPMNRKCLLCASAVIIIASIGIWLRAADAPPAPPTAPLRLVLYAPTFNITQGDVLDVVVEVYNTGKTPIKVPDGVNLELVRAPRPDGIKEAKDIEQRLEEADEPGFFHVKLYCAIPHEDAKWFIAPRDANKSRPEPHLIAPGESALIKVELPNDAFGKGTCTLHASSQKGDVKSIPLKIECAANPALGGKPRRMKQRASQ